MADKFVIPSDRQPWIDPQTGLISRPWFLFLQYVYTRIGGATGTGNATIDGLVADLQTQDAMAASSAAGMAKLSAQLNDALTSLALADVPNYEVARRVADLETLGAFTR